MSWLGGLFGRRQDKRTGAPKGALDDRTLAALARAGGDLAKPTDVINYLYLPDEARAQQAGAELRAAGFNVVVDRAVTGRNWLALANRDLIPSAENIAAMRALFENLATRLGGDYDGWEAAVTK